MPEGCHRTLTLRAAVAPLIVRSVATATNNQTTAGQNNTNAGIQRASLQCHCMFTMLRGSSYRTSSFVGELHRAQSQQRDECECFVSSNFDLWFILKPRPDIPVVFTCLRLSVYFTLRLGLLAQHSSLVYSSYFCLDMLVS